MCVFKYGYEKKNKLSVSVTFVLTHATLALSLAQPVILIYHLPIPDH